MLIVLFELKLVVIVVSFVLFDIFFDLKFVVDFFDVELEIVNFVFC